MQDASSLSRLKAELALTRTTPAAAIGQHEAQVAVVDSDIEYFEGLLQAARTQREGLLGIIDTYRSLSAPVGRIPNEILSLILVAVVDNVPLHKRYHLTLVSRHWRDILDSTPTAWRRILFAEVDAYRAPSPDAVKTHIRKAKQTPLSIEVDLSGLRIRNHLHETIRGWYQLVRRQRWTSLKIESWHAAGDLEALSPFLRGLSDNPGIADMTSFTLHIHSPPFASAHL